MSIVNSTFVVGPAQRDGRKYVVEKHIDNVNVTYVIEYLADINVDYTLIMNDRALFLAELLADNETENLLNGT